MPYGVYAKCACCGKTAYDEEEIEEELGYRNMGDGRKNPIIPQSYCRACRIAGCKAGEPCKAKNQEL